MNGRLVGIMSDSHDHRTGIVRAVDRFNDAGCGLVLHAGDFVAPFTAREFKRLACPMIGVFGNNDGERRGLTAQFRGFAELHDGPYEFEYGAVKFAMMHEPDRLDEYAARDDLDVVVYGHLHENDIRTGKPMVINPGECCAWLTGRRTVVLLDLDTMLPELIVL